MSNFIWIKQCKKVSNNLNYILIFEKFKQLKLENQTLHATFTIPVVINGFKLMLNKNFEIAESCQ